MSAAKEIKYQIAANFDEVALIDIGATKSYCLNSGQASDLTLKCGERFFEVHRAVLQTVLVSPVFAAMLSGPFQESVLENIYIQLEGDHPKALQVVLEILYRVFNFVNNVNVRPRVSQIT